MINISAQGIFPFKEINSKWNVGMMGGFVGYGRDISYGAVGINLTVKGFYADFMGLPPSRENDMGIKRWSDKSSLLVHVGYQIPITKSIRLVPVIGMQK